MEIRPKIAVCVGHSRFMGSRRDGGALAADGKTAEWEFNCEVARELCRLLARTHDPILFDSYRGKGYTAAMGWLAREIQRAGAVFAVELHFNATDGTATGHEWLYWEHSSASKRAAVQFHLEMSRAFPLLPARGAKARSTQHRGAEFLRLTHCPAVIAEPFFGDGDDWRTFAPTSARRRLAEVYAQAIRNSVR